jgi:glycosyltransferase involved in cell wall biosynthesis
MEPADVVELGFEPGKYLTLIARPIPENTILEIVQGFSRQDRDVQLVVLGRYEPDDDPYHRQVMDAASTQVVFAGPIYDKATVQAIRFHGLAYVHGHTVGGTNPSLVEAMAAGNPVIAHDNPYNRWVAGDGGLYFRSAGDFADRLETVLESAEHRQRLADASLERFQEEFTWERVAGQYEALLRRFL